MSYYKTVIDGIVLSVNTVNVSGIGNITEAEYQTLVGMFGEIQYGFGIKDNGDGTYMFVPVETPEPEPTTEEKAEAYDILVGGAS